MGTVWVPNPPPPSDTGRGCWAGIASLAVLAALAMAAMCTAGMWWLS